MFQISVLKDGYPERPLGVPESSNDMRPPSGSNGYDSRTMPAMGTRRQRERLRRPKSGDVRLRGSLALSEDGEGNRNDSTMGGGGDDDDSMLFAIPKQLPPRPRSMAEPGPSFGGEERLQMSSAGLKIGGNHHGSTVASGSTLTRHQAIVHQRSYDQSPTASYSQSSTLKSASSVKSLPDGETHANYPLPSHSTPTVTNLALGKSLNHLPPHGYGIYGSELGEDGEENYSPISPTEVSGSTRRAMKLAHRSRSQGHLVLGQNGQQQYIEGSDDMTTPGGTTNNTTNTGSAVPGSSTPSQHNINAALARSLSPPPPQYRPGLHRPKSCVLPTGDVSLSAASPVEPSPGGGSMMSAMRPRASSHSAAAVVPVSSGTTGGSERPPRENVWDESTCDASLLSVGDLTTAGRRKEAKKKKKERQKRLEESLVSDSGRKKTGIKDSLKNIFFKKR